MSVSLNRDFSVFQILSAVPAQRTVCAISDQSDRVIQVETMVLHLLQYGNLMSLTSGIATVPSTNPSLFFKRRAISIALAQGWINEGFSFGCKKKGLAGSFGSKTAFALIAGVTAGVTAAGTVVAGATG
nr:hypothetical protein Iba_chr10bCG8360 [Ipomoea batatas]